MFMLCVKDREAQSFQFEPNKTYIINSPTLTKFPCGHAPAWAPLHSTGNVGCWKSPQVRGHLFSCFRESFSSHNRSTRIYASNITGASPNWSVSVSQAWEGELHTVHAVTTTPGPFWTQSFHPWPVIILPLSDLHILPGVQKEASVCGKAPAFQPALLGPMLLQSTLCCLCDSVKAWHAGRTDIKLVHHLVWIGPLGW